MPQDTRQPTGQGKSADEILAELDVSLLPDYSTQPKRHKPQEDLGRVWSVADIDRLLEQTDRTKEENALVSAAVSAAESSETAAEEVSAPAPAVTEAPPAARNETVLPSAGFSTVPGESAQPADTSAVKSEQSAQGEDIFVILPADRQKRSSMEDSVLRERFFRTLESEDLFGQDDMQPSPFETIEKPGVVLERSDMQKTADLLPLPTVLSAADVLQQKRQEEKTRIAAGASKTMPPEEPDFSSDQILLSGFGEKTVVEQVDEDALEMDLHSKRKEKIKAFRLTAQALAQDEDEERAAREEAALWSAGAGDADAEEQSERSEKAGKKARQSAARPHEQVQPQERTAEYTNPEQKNRILAGLDKAVRHWNLRVLLLALLFLFTLSLGALPLVFDALSLEKPSLLLPGSGGVLFMNLLLFSFAALLCANDLITGFRLILRGKPMNESLMTVICVAALLCDILLLFLPAQRRGTVGGVHTAALFALLLHTLGKRAALVSTRASFRFCAMEYPQELHTVAEITQEGDAFEIGRGLMMEHPLLLYASRILFPAELFRQCARNGAAAKLIRILLPVTAFVSLATATLTYIVTKQFPQALCAWAATVCLAPVCFSPCLMLTLCRLNRQLAAQGAAITSIDAARLCSGANAVVLDSADVFDSSQCDMHGMKDFKTVRVDDVLLYTSAMVIQSGGPLREAFNKVIAGREELLPPVKNLHYEDKLGLSAWIHGQKVFLGNRSLLLHHNIEVPQKSSEERYKRDGRKVLYLAIAGKLSAMFVVSYRPNAALTASLQALADEGIYLLVSTSDSNITQELLCETFDLPQGMVKVVASKAERLFRKYRERRSPAGLATLLHNGSAAACCKAVTAAGDLHAAARMMTMLQFILFAAGLAISFSAAFFMDWFAYLDWIVLGFHGIALLFLLSGAFLRLGRPERSL